MDNETLLTKITFTAAALANIEESERDIYEDVVTIRQGAETEEALLAFLLDGEDEANAPGWRDYVRSVVEYATKRTKLVIELEVFGPEDDAYQVIDGLLEGTIQMAINEHDLDDYEVVHVQNISHRVVAST